MAPMSHQSWSKLCLAAYQTSGTRKVSFACNKATVWLLLCVLCVRVQSVWDVSVQRKMSVLHALQVCGVCTRVRFQAS